MIFTVEEARDILRIDSQKIESGEIKASRRIKAVYSRLAAAVLGIISPKSSQCTFTFGFSGTKVLYSPFSSSVAII